MAIIDKAFWKGKRVFLTGHTGFKGSWLSLWLYMLGAEVTGYALEPPTDPSLFALCGLEKLLDYTISDVRDQRQLQQTMQAANPDIVMHLAAQPLVRESYRLPLETYATNVMGTANLLEAVRSCKNVRAVVNVTTDKCYENQEWCWGYRENEPLGGYDPYSSSKACSELVTVAYRHSFLQQMGIAVATARAGNVIGGGDWAKDRLVPDCLSSLAQGKTIIIRSPHAIRPWQHVLEPLSGYLLLAQKLYEEGEQFAESWNFGPNDSDAKSVEWIVQKLCQLWSTNSGYEKEKTDQLHEASYLKLDCSKAKMQLLWQPKWTLEIALQKTVDWYQEYIEKCDLRTCCWNQIRAYAEGGKMDE